MTSRKDRNRWKSVGTLLVLSAMLASLIYAWTVAGPAANASVPTGIVSNPPQPGRFGQPLEGGPARPFAPVFTAAPSALETIDPHWAANVRANTDTSPYAQQEPSVAVNPLNHLNVVAAQKDERSAPQPNTATKEVWIDTSMDGGLTWPINTHIPMPGTICPSRATRWLISATIIMSL